jgi:hypothetical protein
MGVVRGRGLEDVGPQRAHDGKVSQLPRVASGGQGELKLRLHPLYGDVAADNLLGQGQQQRLGVEKSRGCYGCMQGNNPGAAAGRG